MMPFDVSKLRKKIDKSIPGVSYGFNDPATWLDTGCYALNYLVSNRFDGGLPLEGKFTMFAGDSGSGKSYIASANIIKDAQKKSVGVVGIDTENALDLSWLEGLGVDTTPGMFEKVSIATVDDCAQVINDIIDLYRSQNDGKPYADRQRLLIVIDSLGMLITPNMEKQFAEGDMKGDLGIKAKQVTAMIRVIMAKIASQPIGVVATNHVFDAQDKYKPDSIPGGKMLEFASSVIIQMNKYLLKEDEDGVKLEDGMISGIRSTMVVRKSRYAKPFEKVKVSIPYDTGMDPYSGLFDLFEGKGVLKKEGNQYVYISPETGEVFKKFRKHFKRLGILDQIMSEWSHWDAKAAEGVDLTEPLTEEELADVA